MRVLRSLTCVAVATGVLLQNRGQGFIDNAPCCSRGRSRRRKRYVHGWVESAISRSCRRQLGDSVNNLGRGWVGPPTCVPHWRVGDLNIDITGRVSAPRGPLPVCDFPVCVCIIWMRQQENMRTSNAISGVGVAVQHCRTVTIVLFQTASWPRCGIPNGWYECTLLAAHSYGLCLAVLHDVEDDIYWTMYSDLLT